MKEFYLMLKLVLFPAFVFLFLLTGCRSFFSSGKNFTLATFNVRCPVDKTPHSWEERKSRCLAVIRRNRLDIFGVQEAYRNQLDDLTADGQYAFIGKGRNDFKDQGEFSAILYKKERFEVLDSGTFGLSEKPHVPGFRSWNSRHPRIATWGLFRDKKNGKTFVYYNTHLDNYSEDARINGIKLLMKHASENAADAPLILTGDFNSRPDTPTWKTAAFFLKDSSRISRTPHTGPVQTFHSYGRKTFTYPIDFIFVSDSFTVHSHRTDDTRFPEGFASDHYPVIVSLTLK